MAILTRQGGKKRGGHPLARENAKQLIKWFDQNNDGKLSLAEVSLVWSPSFACLHSLRSPALRHDHGSLSLPTSIVLNEACASRRSLSLLCSLRFS